jgi:hypothetical protein
MGSEALRLLQRWGKTSQNPCEFKNFPNVRLLVTYNPLGIQTQRQLGCGNLVYMADQLVTVTRGCECMIVGNKLNCLK